MRAPLAKSVPALVVVALLALLVAPSAGAAARCSARGAKTVVQNSQARVFAVKGKGAVKRRIYGCVRGAKPVLLASDVSPKASDETHTRNSSFRLGGTNVAFVQVSFSDFGVGEYGSSIEVRPLRHGGRRLSQDVSYYQGVTALAVRADGAVAWLLKASSAYTEVDAVDSNSKLPAALAYARRIDGRSLKLDATSVHWTQDGSDRSAEVR